MQFASSCAATSATPAAPASRNAPVSSSSAPSVTTAATTTISSATCGSIQRFVIPTPDVVTRAQKFVRWLGSHSWVVLLVVLLVVLGTWGFIKLADEVREGDTQKFDDWAIHAM